MFRISPRRKRPTYRPESGAKGDDGIGGDKPFIMHPDGLGWIWVPSGLKDGPLPAHYEPLEAPVRNQIVSSSRLTLRRKNSKIKDNPYASSPDARFPHVLTTYRLTEHHTAGGMSRFLSHLAELQPELFCEISTELAEELNVEHGSFVTIATARGIIEARALVTPRIKPIRLNGHTVHQVGLPYHWGYKGLAKGDVVNDLIALSQEPNVRIMETKALLCSVTPGRRSPSGKPGAVNERI